MLDRPHHWTLPELDNYVEETLRQMARNRDVTADPLGGPIYEVITAGTLSDGTTQRIDLEADLSAIGMPFESPLTVIARQDEPLAWFLDDVFIATTPGDHTPEQAADALGMDQLLAAHRTWVGRSGGRGGR